MTAPAAAPGLNADLVALSTATGSSSLSKAAAGAASGAAIGSVVPLVGTGLGAAIGAVAGVFGGTGDVSPFQDTRVQELAELALQHGEPYLSWLAGETGRYGVVVVPGGRAKARPLLAAGADVDNWALHGASNWGGSAADDGKAGPTVRIGSQDLAWQALQVVCQHLNLTLPPPNQYATNSPGQVNNAASPTVLPWSGNGALGSLSTLFTTGTLKIGAGVVPSWVWWILLVILLAVLLWWWWRRRRG